MTPVMTTDRLLDFIVKYKAIHGGNLCSYDVIARKLNISKTTVVDVINQLEELGKITRGEAGIEVVGGK